MTVYDIKRGHYKNIEGEQLEEIIRNYFGGVSREGDALTASYGAIARLTVKPIDKKTMDISTEMDTTVSNDVAADTIGRYNKFLFDATGFTSKQRKKRAEKRAKEGK